MKAIALTFALASLAACSGSTPKSSVTDTTSTQSVADATSTPSDQQIPETTYRCSMDEVGTDAPGLWGTIIDRPWGDDLVEVLGLTPIVSTSDHLVEGVVYAYRKNGIPELLLQIRLNHDVVVTKQFVNPRPWPQDSPAIYADLNGDGATDVDLSCFSWGTH